jgi:hypothetical protein
MDTPKNNYKKECSNCIHLDICMLYKENESMIMGKNTDWDFDNINNFAAQIDCKKFYYRNKQTFTYQDYEEIIINKIKTIKNARLLLILDSIIEMCYQIIKEKPNEKHK